MLPHCGPPGSMNLPFSMQYDVRWAGKVVMVNGSSAPLSQWSHVPNFASTRLGRRRHQNFDLGIEVPFCVEAWRKYRRASCSFVPDRRKLAAGDSLAGNLAWVTEPNC